MGGTNTVLLVDNSTVSGTYLYVNCDAVSGAGNIAWNGNLQIVFAGKEPCMTYSGSALYKYAGATTVRAIFKVPVGGYATTPLRHTNESEAFLKSGSGKWFSLEVAEDSPAVLQGSGLKNHVLVETSSGFNMNVINDLSAPKRAKLAWGADGAPLEEGADLADARQVLLTLPGSGLKILIR